ncbi:hypothetical protein FDJ06_gp103 [Pseudomonas phage SL2]|uniref:Uncharacterized protein n=1 Tax=Pseudomonas phage SL2 TaxID=2041345 RepID=A0A2D1GQR2_9CAUD|nr:hypothetical protein FDJ06_gp103 [Pseudomonas phage SL2]ATN94680.1 hypothetical protein SL2_103 [Pseudomonas phage SL2]
MNDIMTVIIGILFMIIMMALINWGYYAIKHTIKCNKLYKEALSIIDNMSDGLSEYQYTVAIGRLRKKAYSIDHLTAVKMFEALDLVIKDKSRKKNK